ncbi:GGDEF domain-containing protein [Paraliobacillus zengyii]|uniref:GGDEF domain-containing protein n=1 Tax=Paraliobacillus zengyii TaxID=2213194 RepID=UPI000E3D6999|nr:GGDEF domain-containing protein [Paraliobacillus zengyii]
MYESIILIISMNFLALFIFFQLYFRFVAHLKSKIIKYIVLGIGFGLIQSLFYQFPIAISVEQGPIFLGGSTFLIAGVYGGSLATFIALSIKNLIERVIDNPFNPMLNLSSDSNGINFMGPTHNEFDLAPDTFFFIEPYVIEMLFFTILVAGTFRFLSWKPWKIWLLLNVIFQIYLMISQKTDLYFTLIRATIEIAGGALIFYFISYMYNSYHNKRELERKAYNDGLTGLYNVRYFKMIILKLFQKFQNTSTRNLTLAIIDIDHFKAINDTHGHLVGDQMLVGLAEELKKSFQNEVVSRNGGEEFTVLITNKDRLSVKELIETFHLNIQERKFFMDQKIDPLHITVSIGVAYLENDINSPEQMYDLADKSLYKAKQSGRNQICYADSSEKNN